MARPQYSIFALAGPTGGGKSTFASLASDRDHLEIGDGRRPCTLTPQEVTFRFEGQVVTLIDTPGFGDPNGKDEDVLEHIAKYLARNYEKGLLLDGLILFHPAGLQSGMNEEKYNSEIVQSLLGKDVFDRVAIVSTMWDKLPNQRQARAIQQEDHRKQPGGVWHSMCNQGAVVFRHDNTKPSADSIIRFLTSRPQRPFPVQIQEELVSHKGHLASTSAGKDVHRRFDAEISKREQIHQNALRGRAERSLKRASQLEKQINALAVRRARFERIKVRVGGFFTQLSRIFTPFSSDDPGLALPESRDSVDGGSVAELDG